MDKLELAAAFVLTITAISIFFRTYLTDGISTTRRALLNLCSLVLFGIGFALWMSGGPQ